jgi:exodeoxyribonuclease III
MKIATWNVNGIRAREAQLQEWVERERPDVICLQEIKASPDQIPAALCEMEGYWCYWHGEKGYSGVALHVSRAFSPERPRFSHPAFDYENRIVLVRLPAATVVSVYVPNGGKDYPAKMRFLAALEEFSAEVASEPQPIVICGDLNIARTDMDVHPKERKPNAIGQLPEERDQLERIIGRGGLVDSGRALAPDDDQMFTWWAPWRNMRQRNIGWRLDYVLTSHALFQCVRSCAVQREIGTSDHAPVVAEFSIEPPGSGLPAPGSSSIDVPPAGRGQPRLFH